MIEGRRLRLFFDALFVVVCWNLVVFFKKMFYQITDQLLNVYKAKKWSDVFLRLGSCLGYSKNSFFLTLSMEGGGSIWHDVFRYFSHFPTCASTVLKLIDFSWQSKTKIQNMIFVPQPPSTGGTKKSKFLKLVIEPKFYDLLEHIKIGLTCIPKLNELQQFS